MRRGFIAIVIAGCVSLLLLASGRAQVVPLPANGDFEGGPTGWAPTTGGTLTIDGSQPVNDGGAAGHVLATSAGTVTIRTQYWLSPATPGNKYSMSLSVRIPAATITAVTARIDLVDGSGAALVSNLAAKPGPTAGYVMLNVAQVTAPANTEYALVVISGSATGAGGASPWTTSQSPRWCLRPHQRRSSNRCRPPMTRSRTTPARRRQRARARRSACPRRAPGQSPYRSRHGW